jgi:hypothetical protein
MMKRIAELKAEVERLTEFTTRTIIPNEQLQAEVERLKQENLRILGLEANQVYLYREIDILNDALRRAYIQEAWYLQEINRLR